MELYVSIFLAKGSFFCAETDKEQMIEFIHSQCTYKFGDYAQAVIYTFEREHYNIEFILDDENQIIKGEQIEIHQKPSTPCLSAIFEFSQFKKEAEHIESMYSDAEETVAFMKNGNNVYFYNHQLIKIISKSEASRNLAIKTMDRIT